jgi:hypothetical protein
MGNKIYFAGLMSLFILSCGKPVIHETNDSLNIRARAIQCNLKNEIYIDAPHPLYGKEQSGYDNYGTHISISTLQDWKVEIDFESSYSEIATGEYNVEYHRRNLNFATETGGVVIRIGDIGIPDSYIGVKGKLNVVNLGNHSYKIDFCDIEFKAIDGSKSTLFIGYGNFEF